jgi:RNA polymerase sigma-70 factor (ECF subfamily)
MQRTSDGDDRSARFTSLFESHHGSVRAYVLRRAAGDAAQDAIADTFLVAWRRLEDVPADALPWLYGVARRVLANQRRSAARAQALAARLQYSDPGPSPVDDRVADAQIVRLALDSLGDADREGLMLVAWESLEPERAARSAGCSRATFAVRLHRARRRLLAALERQEEALLAPTICDPVEARP